MAPKAVDMQTFTMNTMQVSAMPCLQATGINDRAVILGRDAADVMLGSYDVWQKGDERLNNTRTAQEVWFRIASNSGLSIKPDPMPVAAASYTRGGLPCFEEKTFNLNEDARKDGYEQCFAESAIDAPVASLFSTFSCEAMSPSFYDLLWPMQVHRLQQTVAELADSGSGRSPVLLTVVDKGEEDMAINMLTSMHFVGEDTLSLVVGTSNGICKSLADSFGVAGSKCIVLHPAQDVRRSVFKHAILTTVALAGLSERITYASPHATFVKPFGSQMAKSDKPILS